MMRTKIFLAAALIVIFMGLAICETTFPKIENKIVSPAVGEPLKTSSSNYIIVSSPSNEGLAAQVNARINEGYIPQGGVSVYSGYTSHKDLYQAMIKE